MTNNKPIYEYDSNGNLIHSKGIGGFERWCEYDADGNCIHYKDSNGIENWFDSEGNVIAKPTKEG
jgi:YD repeat-containing protein